MRTVKVSIFTEEYFIWVYFGSRKEIVEAGAKYVGQTVKRFNKDFLNSRGQHLDYLGKGLYSLIIVRTDLSKKVIRAVLAHEASHAMDSLQKYIGINDRNGEFKAHGIAAVMRQAGKYI